MSHHILLVDDDELVVRSIARILRLNHEVTTAANGEEALARLAERSFDVVLSDVWMPVMDGMSLLRIVRARYPDLPVVLITGLHFPDLEAQGKRLGAVAILEKPLTPDALLKALRAVLGDGA